MSFMVQTILHFAFVEVTGKTTVDPEAGTNLTVSN